MVQKITKESSRDCKSHGTIIKQEYFFGSPGRFKFQDCYWLKLIVFFISQFDT